MGFTRQISVLTSLLAPMALPSPPVTPPVSPRSATLANGTLSNQPERRAVQFGPPQFSGQLPDQRHAQFAGRACREKYGFQLPSLTGGIAAADECIGVLCIEVAPRDAGRNDQRAPARSARRRVRRSADYFRASRSPARLPPVRQRAAIEHDVCDDTFWKRFSKNNASRSGASPVERAGLISPLAVAPSMKYNRARLLATVSR